MTLWTYEAHVRVHHFGRPRKRILSFSSENKPSVFDVMRAANTAADEVGGTLEKVTRLTPQGSTAVLTCVADVTINLLADEPEVECPRCLGNNIGNIGGNRYCRDCGCQGL